MATCQIRDECWAEIDEKSLGSVIRNATAAKRAKTKHRKPSIKRLHACGFEGTALSFCPKYRARVATSEQPLQVVTA